MQKRNNLKRIIVLFLLFAFVTSYAFPISAFAEEKENKVVRVGWYDSSFCYYDKFGRRCGIDYEYQQKISAYTGWTYEYVEGSWPVLFKMLQDGEIDILSDVSYKPEREEYVLYPDLPMGTESYYIFVSVDNKEINSDNPESMKGKRIGVNKGSVQEGFLAEWADKYNVKFEIVPLTVSEEEYMNMVSSGKLDGYASVYTYDFEDKITPVFRIGGSDYYYAVNKNRPDLLKELNLALAEIQDDDPYFNHKISEDRLYSSKNNALIKPNQEDWLKEHGTIRVGYRDDYLPFCDTDDETGELTGALKDYLVHSEKTLNNPDLKFEPVSYESVEAALEALSKGEIDCVFPVYLTTYDADQKGLRVTEPAMKTEVTAVMRKSDSSGLSKDSRIIFAYNARTVNLETFIKEEYPEGIIVPYKGLSKCCEAVGKGDADCFLIPNYRIHDLEYDMEKNKLYSFPTGEPMEFSFAMRKEDTELYFLMNKTVLVTETEDMDAALASYMNVSGKVTIKQFLRENMIAVLLAIFVIFALIIFLLTQKMKADRIAVRQRMLLEEAKEVADLKQTISSLLDNMPGMSFTKDAETGAYLACNQEFAEYVHKDSPSEVVGHTPKELFDEETAKHFIEDDNLALSMDEPYVFFDVMPDKDGKPRQVKTTKRKYIDANGKTCVLGTFQDVTDSFRISRNNVSSKESYESARSSGVIFTHIAQTLAEGYLELYYIDINSEEFIEYRIDRETGVLAERKRGWHFFEICLDEIEELVYPDDWEVVKEAMDRKTLEAAMEEDGSFTMSFRINGDPDPRYVSMRIARLKDDERYLILGITDVDEQMREHNAVQKMQEEQIAYNRISALAGEFLCIYVVNPEKGHYREFSDNLGLENYGLSREGWDFYADTRNLADKIVYPEDMDRFCSALTKENILGEVEENGVFTLSYRIVKDGEPLFVQLKAAMVDEGDESQLIVGINDIDAQVRQEEEYGKRLAQARIEANIDALTGVKNRNAYRIYEERLNAQIEINRAPDFALTILDVNDLKMVNDTQGHKAGDQYLRDACRIICTTFKRSPVFRVGGDEFAVLSQGDDYAHIDELLDQMNKHNDDAIENGGVVIAIGMAKYEHEDKVAPVYERADRRMYENKGNLKARKKHRG